MLISLLRRGSLVVNQPRQHDANHSTGPAESAGTCQGTSRYNPIPHLTGDAWSFSGGAGVEPPG